MKAIWSFWTKPLTSFQASSWLSERHHYFGWVLSYFCARNFFSQTVLYTDELGAKILIDGLGLDFDEVHTGMNELDEYHPHFWAIGKIYTYQVQQEPFIHLDSDVFLWKPLPEALLVGPVFTQNPEYFTPGDSWYQIEKFDVIKNDNGWLPMELVWYKESKGTHKAECCGIMGGNYIEFIQYYADQSIKLVDRNQQAWERLGRDNILVEQYLLSSCLEYHQNNPDSGFSDVRVHHLFHSSEDAFNPESARNVGYTHLIGGAKKNKQLLFKLEERIKRCFPDHYEKCVTLANENLY